MDNNSKIIVVHVLSKHEYETKCLLMRRAKGDLKGNWQPVTGKVIEGETAVQGALRELREETGRSPDVFYSADFVETFYLPSIDKIILAPTFVAFFEEKEPIHLSPNEHDNYQWVSLDKASLLMEFSGQIRALEHIEREFILKSPNPRFLLESTL